MQNLSLTRKIWVVTVSVAALLLIGNSAFATAYSGRILPGIKVGSLDLGGLTRQQAFEVLKQQTSDYTLNIDFGAKNVTVNPKRFGGGYDANETVNQAYLIGRNQFFDLAGLLESYSQGRIRLAYTVNQPKFIAFVTALAKENSLAPTDARIVINSGKVSVEPEKAGVGIDRKDLLDRIDTSFSSFEENTIVVTATTLEPAVKVVDTGNAVEQAKKIMALPVNLHLGDRVFKPTANEIGDWIAFKSDQGKVVPYIDQGRVKTYLLELSEKLYIAPVNKKLDLINGVAKVTQEGKDGAAVDYEPAAGAIATALGSGKGLDFTFTTRPVPYKTIKSQVVDLAGGRYIEINIPQQRLWAYDNFAVVYESPLTSGATSAGFGTPYGLFAIYYKTTDFWLDGRRLGFNYRVYVNYWMPFNGNIGLHDASWRNGNFGGQDYINGGSHGCVNLPLETAAFLYNWAGNGTPVWVHG